MPTAAAKGAAKGRPPVTIWHNPKYGTSRKVLDMPVVRAAKGTRLCRPPERLKDIL